MKLLEFCLELCDISEHDQARFVLQSPQLATHISLSFRHFARPTTERVSAEFEHIVQSNREFRLNDNLNYCQFSACWNAKRRRWDKGKFIWKNVWREKFQIQNAEKICLASALVVSIAKIENDDVPESIVDDHDKFQLLRGFLVLVACVFLKVKSAQAI